jgi:hypothetical protein
MENFQGTGAVRVIYPDYFPRSDAKTSFLPDFSLGRLGGYVAYVRPSTGHRPAAIGALAHQQELAVPEDSPANVDSRRSISDLLVEGLYQRWILKAGMLADNLSCYLQQALVPMTLIFVF